MLSCILNCFFNKSIKKWLFYFSLFTNSALNAQINDIIGKSFTVQYKWLDSSLNSISNYENSKKSEAIEKWISEVNVKGDKSLIALLREKSAHIKLTSYSDSVQYEKILEALYQESQKSHLKELKAFVLQKQADFFWIRKDYAQSLEKYLYAHEAYKNLSIDTFPPKVEYIYTLGGRYYYFKDYNSAIKYFKEVWENISYKYIENKPSKMNTLALCYSNLNNHDSAIFYFNKAMDLAIKDSVELWVGIISGNLGYIYLKQGNVDSALVLYKKNIELSRKYNLINDLANACSGYGALLLLKHKNKEGMQYQMEALKIVHEKQLYKSKSFIARIYPFVAQTFAANNNYRLAYQYLDSSFNAYQEIEKEKNMLYLLGAQHNIDVAKHMAEVQSKEKEIEEQRYLMRILLIGSLVLLLFLSVFAIQRYQLAKAKKVSDIQKQRSEELLLNILPQEVAEELKLNGNAKAKHFENATVLFTDFVNFTQLSEILSPQDLVAEIHECFSAFDKIIEKHKMEKIKTIGDAYLAASGLPITNTNHAIVAINAASDILDYINNRKSNTHQVQLDVRIGINSGPVVAGIVGIKKFAYDIWGDTVNTAARMEQNCEKGKINISGSTYELVKAQFDCMHRGKIEAKNKGKIDMYYVNV